EPNSATTYSPLWTPDGQSIVYEPSGSGLQGLKMLPADGSNATPASVTPPGHFHPHGWSKDGQELLTAFTSGPATGWDIAHGPPGTWSESRLVATGNPLRSSSHRRTKASWAQRSPPTNDSWRTRRT